MNTLNIGLIGYGNVGSGVIKFLKKEKTRLKDKFNCRITIKSICDLNIKKNPPAGLGPVALTTNYHDILKDPQIDGVVELIGGVHPAYEIASGALQAGKHFVTANKSLIARHGRELFELAVKNNRSVCFESSVMAGVPVIKTIHEGVAGNRFNGLFGIINGTCNYILSEMSHKDLTFNEALKDAQKRGFAESDPTLDINGMDATHKLAILVALTMGKFIDVKDIYTEGITHISHIDIEHAETMGLCIKLLAIAKKDGKKIEARVHPTLISKDHPLASIHGIHNAIFMDTRPLGNVLLSGEGAGQMAAASGVISDLINLAAQQTCSSKDMMKNVFCAQPGLSVKPLDQVSTKFYLRFMSTDKPGVLSQIAGVLGRHGISINSVTQKMHERTATVPVIMLTDFAQEKHLRKALEQIQKLASIKSKPVAIRMEKLSE